MAQEQKEITKTEKRTFRYSNEVVFEFDLDVSEPEVAVAEISDFLNLMKSAGEDLAVMREEFAAKIEAPKEEAAAEGEEAN